LGLDCQETGPIFPNPFQGLSLASWALATRSYTIQILGNGIEWQLPNRPKWWMREKEKKWKEKKIPFAITRIKLGKDILMEYTNRFIKCYFLVLSFFSFTAFILGFDIQDPIILTIQIAFGTYLDITSHLILGLSVIWDRTRIHFPFTICFTVGWRLIRRRSIPRNYQELQLIFFYLREYIWYSSGRNFYNTKKYKK